MGGTTEGKLIGKFKELFYLYLSLHCPSNTIRHCFYFHYVDNCNCYCWGGYLMLLVLFGLIPWSDNDSLVDWVHHEYSSRIVSNMGFLDCYQHFYCWHFHHYWCYCYCYYCSTKSESEPIAFTFVEFSVPVEESFGWNEVSSVSLSVGCNTLSRPSTTCATRCVGKYIPPKEILSRTG